MAFRGVRNLRSMLTQMEGGKRSITASTIPKMKPMTPTVDAHVHAQSRSREAILKAELAPVFIVGGMVLVAVTMGIHTSIQQLGRSPSVHVNKKKRESMPEVEDPDQTINSADKFINKSFLRKVAHIQDHNPTLHDPVHPNPFARPRTAETLKTVGIDPSRH